MPLPENGPSKNRWVSFFHKMRGGEKSTPRVSLSEIFWSGLGAFLGIGLVGFLHFSFLPNTDLILIIGSFGASAVLLYGAPNAPLGQPRNLLGGHLLSAVVGVTMYQWFPNTPWLAASLAVSLAIVGMHFTKTLHPPGGATALIAVIGSEKIHNLSYLYALIPVGVGTILLLLVALWINNIAPSRRYPLYWW